MGDQYGCDWFQSFSNHYDLVFVPTMEEEVEEEAKMMVALTVEELAVNLDLE